MIVVVKCRHCGHEFDSEAESNSAVCPACQNENRVVTPRISIPPEYVKKPEPGLFAVLKPCEYCKMEISRKAVFCPHCGGFKSIPFGLVLGAVFYFIAASALASLWIELMSWVIKQIFG